MPYLFACLQATGSGARGVSFLAPRQQEAELEESRLMDQMKEAEEKSILAEAK